ncbi:MAG: T9SS type A sorting domain-containing protein, partial [Mariniphaga sp.]|nr:T9SS type A sorting domain-containing protein [Mariniphaga sp.]
AEKKYYNPTSANGFSVYSDTLFSMELDSAEIIYDVAFHVEDKQTGNSIVHAKVEIDSIIKTTDFSGNVAYSLKPGNYQVRISENDYKSLEVDVTIQSDTLLTFRLEKLFAEIKFRLKNQGVPVNKALVVLNNDSLFTSSLGIATFRSLPVDSTYSYKINKDNYQTLQGSLILTTDITLNLEIEKMSTGINELKKVDFHFYPNPAGNYLNIESENGLGKLELLKSNGSVIRSFKALSTLKTISLSNFPNGFYFIRRYGGDDMLPEVKSLIIRR